VFFGSTTGTPAGTAFVSGQASPTAANASQHIIYNTTTGALYYDSDGNGASAPVEFAVLDNHAALVNTDFVIF